MGILSQVRTGVESRPMKNMILGVNGIGKTTFMADWPKPLIIDLEFGSSHINVPRLDGVFTVAQFRETIKELQESNHDYQSIGIDTLDALEKMIFGEVCVAQKVNSIEDVGYGKGFTMAGEIMSELMMDLIKLNNRGVTINIACHVGVKPHNDPTLPQAYDRWTPRVCRQVAAPVKDLCDNIFFASFKTVVVKENNKPRAFGDGERVLWTQWRPSHDGKNRLGLPFELPFSYSALKSAIDNAKPETAEQVLTEVSEMIKAVKDSGLIPKIETALKSADGNVTQLKAIRERLRTMIESQ